MDNGDQGESIGLQERPDERSADFQREGSDVTSSPNDDSVDSVEAVVAVEAAGSAVEGVDSSRSGEAGEGAVSDAGVKGGIDADLSETDGAEVSSTASDSTETADAEGISADSSHAADDGSEEADSSAPRSPRGSIRDLEEEGEVAADYLEELLDIVDVDGDIDIDVENGRASLAIVAEGGSDRVLRRLVGSNGEVLEALQELPRLAVQASTGERSRLMLDVAGHRAHRRKVLSDKATQACEQVKTSGKALSLEPMSAFERKIVHDVVAAAGLESESEGVDPHRHVVILPAAA